VDAKQIDALAARIAEGRRSKKPMDFLAAATADLSEADSYKVQFAVHDRLTDGGSDRIAGWKVALTLPTQYQPLKLSGPVFAGIYQSGVRASGAVFEKGWPIKSGIEPELVARMSKDVTAGNTPYTADTIPSFVANLYCGMELVENRYPDVTKLSGPGRIADQSHAGLIRMVYPGGRTVKGGERTNCSHPSVPLSRSTCPPALLHKAWNVCCSL